MRVLVTGATGCLGRNLTERLLKEGWIVSATGRNKKVGLELQKQGAIFFNTNLEDEQAIVSLCENQDVVFHCGALSSPWGKYDDFYKANVTGTINIIKGCLQNKKLKRLVYISSPSIYFDHTEKFNVHESEVLPDKNINHYINTKKIAENKIDEAFKLHQLPVITLRPRAIIGPYDTTILPRIIRASKSGYVPLINHGKALVDITYVDNVIEAMILSTQSNKNTLGKKYNITNDEPMVLKDILEYSFQQLGIKCNYKNISYEKGVFIAKMMEFFASFPGVSWEPALTKYSVGVLGLSQTLDITAAKKELNYKPIIEIKKGIKLFAKWWKTQNVT